MGAPGMAAGGLTTLPLPDDMFNEPDAGGYAAGGIVAFQAGGGVDDDEEIPVTPIGREGITAPAPGFPSVDTVPVAPRDVPEPTGPQEYYGNLADPFKMKERIEQLSPQSSERRAQLDAYLDRILSPETQRERRREDMWMTLGQIGARMASTPGSLLQAASAGIAEALPGVRSAAAARRAEERGALSELARNEGLTNAEARDMYRLIQEGTNRYGQFNENRLTREQAREMKVLEEKQANFRARLDANTRVQTAGISAEATKYASREEFRIRRAAAFDSVYNDLRQTAALDPGYQAAVNGPEGLAGGERYLRDEAFAIIDRQFGGGDVDLGRY
jgi:hypothetical protein